MMWSAIAGALGPVINGITNLVDELHTSDEEKQTIKLKMMEAQYMILAQALQAETDMAAQQAKIIKAEAQGHSWLQRNWRPLLMASFIVILVNNYVLLPYAAVLGAPVQPLELPTGAWALLTTGVGGYIGGRTLEKIGGASALKQIITAKTEGGANS